MSTLSPRKTQRKKRIRIVLLVLIVLLSVGFYVGIRYAYVGSAYASKITCSCHFLSGRALADIRTNDLYAVSFADVSIDDVNQTVTSSIYGLATTQAMYREGFGCTLVNEIAEEELRKQKFTYQRKPVPHTFQTAAASVYFDSLKLEAAIQKIFVQDSAKDVHTRAVVILKDGKLIYEKYGLGYQRNSRLIGWSMTKSVTNAMVGLLVHDKKLDIYKPVPIKEWQNDDRKAITINDLLHMSSGLDWKEDYATPSDATQMLFRSVAAGDYALHSQRKHAPGEVHVYSSGTSNIIQEIIRRQFPSLEAYHQFPYQRLFDKIGMGSAVLEPDPSGTFVGSSFMYATALDWARFGQLYLQDGVWNGEQILPKGWAAYSGTETPHSHGKYAAHFWVDHNHKAFPADAYYANGFEGQFVNIIPSENMVIVRLGCTHGLHFDNSGFVIDILKAKQ